MAKKTASTPAQEPATPAPAPAGPVIMPGLPESLAELTTTASHAAVTAAMAAAALARAPDDEGAKAASNGAATVLSEALEAIDAWCRRHVSGRLAAADAEAERQLEAKREELAAALDELEAKRAEAATALETLEDTPAATEEGGGGDAPADLAVAIEDGREMITVIGPAGGLRRAGHLFNAVPSTVMVTPAERAAIAADPALSITGGLSHGAEFAVRAGLKPEASDFRFEHGFTHVKVLGPKGGRRRIGHTFGQEESIVRVGREDLERLLADDQLAVGAA